MSKIFMTLIIGGFLTAISPWVHAADTNKTTGTEMIDTVKSKIRGERAEGNAEEQAEANYEATKEKAENYYEAAREKCEGQAGAAERTCKQQARAEYKSAVTQAKVIRKKAKADADMLRETSKTK